MPILGHGQYPHPACAGDPRTTNNHHHDVPFRVLNKVSTFTAPDGLPANSTDNRIIHGDNLEALRSLLPEFEAG